jgi:hypothetical protein
MASLQFIEPAGKLSATLRFRDPLNLKLKTSSSSSSGLNPFIVPLVCQPSKP